MKDPKLEQLATKLREKADEINRFRDERFTSYEELLTLLQEATRLNLRVEVHFSRGRDDRIGQTILLAGFEQTIRY